METKNQYIESVEKFKLNEIKLLTNLIEMLSDKRSLKVKSACLLNTFNNCKKDLVECEFDFMLSSSYNMLRGHIFTLFDLGLINNKEFSDLLGNLRIIKSFKQGELKK
jgi:hypothetical protein